MVTKSFVKTVVSGLLNRFGRLEISEVELLELFSELDIIQPVTNSEGAMYVNSAGQIYIL